MYLEVQNIDNYKFVFRMTTNPVGVNGIDPVRQGFDRSTLFGDCDRTSMAWRSLFNGLAKWVNALANRVNALANRVNAIDPYGIRRHPKNKFVIVNILDL